MTRILAIDPGSERSAWIVLNAGRPEAHGIAANADVLDRLRWWGTLAVRQLTGPVVIEWMSPRGMPTSAQEFETAFWAGRFAEAAQPSRVERLTRDRVKYHLTGHRNAKDPNVRAALIDRFGGVGGKAAAVGTKRAPGPLYGIANDVWAALAVAVTWADTEGGDR